MSLDQITAARTNDTFKSRVMSAAWKAALDIVGEAATASPNVDKKRHDFGVRILNDDSTAMTAVVSAVAANAGEVSDPTSVSDAVIDTSVASVWNDIAGVQSADT